jgi:hypothetical protein
VALEPELARRHQAGGPGADDGDAERARRHQIDREGATDTEESLLPISCFFFEMECFFFFFEITLSRVFVFLLQLENRFSCFRILYRKFVFFGGGKLLDC